MKNTLFYRRHMPRAALLAPLAAALLCGAIRNARADIVKLRNGTTVTCKIVKEMDGFIKVRAARRGKVVTTFLHKGAIDSISKASDAENRKLFQTGGVRNPGRTFEPVYYSGVTVATKTGPAAPGGMAATKRGKAAGAKKRGIEARRERSDKRAKERSERGKGASASSSAPAQAGAPAESSAPASSPSSTGTASSTAVRAVGAGVAQ